ncbi:hypothetical protein [Lichenicoccus roseus]|uniref:Phage tail protein n=1 Tax=Lichenicoccus roseus TaxID=2683649 RepID=A0A5R9J545_9PROT|nr:hypothetical protein [Lichenicoccus roseus]TLU72682.1 hypothetical protein FE263_11660 [Lichenicoccus roseus]
MGNPYSIGRDCQVVLLWNGIRIDLRDVVGFQAEQQVKLQRSDPLNSVPVEFNTPAGWRGQFHIDRGSSALDDLIVAIEAAFWNAGIIGSGTIYQYVNETDGSTSTYEFTGVALTLSNSGTYKAEAIVTQTINFFASQRNRI